MRFSIFFLINLYIKSVVDAAIAAAKAGATLEEQVEMAMDRLFVAFGAEILKVKLLNTTYYF